MLNEAKPPHHTGVELGIYMIDESELTLSFPLMLQIQWIMLWLLRHMGLMVFVVMACVSDGCSITLFTHVGYTQRQLAVGEKRQKWANWPHTHLQYVTTASLQPFQAENMSLR